MMSFWKRFSLNDNIKSWSLFHLASLLLAYLKTRMQHEQEGFSSTVKCLTGFQRIRQEGPKKLMD